MNEFFQSLGFAEILITIAIIVICVSGRFGDRKLNKKLDSDIKWFEKCYGKKK
jgi:hypothetical protein